MRMLVNKEEKKSAYVTFYSFLFSHLQVKSQAWGFLIFHFCFTESIWPTKSRVLKKKKKNRVQK